MCFFPSNHSLRQFTWINFIDPVQLQGDISWFDGSSSDRHILHIYWSLPDLTDCYLWSMLFFILNSCSLYLIYWSSKSNGLLSNPASVSPLFKFLISITSVIPPLIPKLSFSNVVILWLLLLLFLPILTEEPKRGSSLSISSMSS